MKFATLFILSFLLASSPPAFSNDVDCSLILKSLVQRAPDPLPISSESIRIEGEQGIAGNILSHDQDFSPLNDGAYVYIIDKNGTIAFSNRVPDLNNVAEPLASHRSVYEKLKTTQKAKPEIVAAGEFEIQNHQVALLNNKSGTFRGNAKNLEWSESVLKQRGLKIKPETERADLALEAVSGKHNTELEGAQAQLRVLSNPRYKQIADQVQKAQASIYRYYPSKTPGKVDWYAFLNASESKLSKGKKVPTMEFYTKMEWSWAHHLFTKSQNFTEFSVELERMIHELGVERTSQIIDRFFEAEGVLYK